MCLGYISGNHKKEKEHILLLFKQTDESTLLVNKIPDQFYFTQLTYFIISLSFFFISFYIVIYY